jgi:signal transduction histidine kinase
MNQSSESGTGNATAEKESHLSISSHVVVQLGAELVTDVEQALLELAKNAYDADSDICEIIVEPDWKIEADDPVYGLIFPDRPSSLRVPEKVGRLLVRDYGGGIPAHAVDLGWLRISASLKRAVGENPKPKTQLHRRTPVGDKGLGRLATMKIGTVLRLRTVTEGEEAWRTVSFSWGEFTPERTLDQIRVLKDTDATMEVTEPGTIIEIIQLHEPEHWRKPEFIEKELIPHLSSLISPFQSQDAFSISVKAGGRTFELETLHEDVLNLASAKFEFSWDGVKLTQKGWLATSLFRGSTSQDDQIRFDAMFDDANREKLLEHIVAHPKLKDRNATTVVAAPWLLGFSEESDFPTFPTDKQYPGGLDPGPFNAEIYYFMFNKATRDKLQQAGVSVMQMQAMANVAIYRDGFRVRAQKDWLRLSESSTRGGSFYELRPTNVIGFFALTNEFNSRLVEKSDREGFVDNREFRGFMTLSQRCKSYANSVLEVTRRAVNEFAVRSVAKVNVEPTPRLLAERLESAEAGSGQDIRRAKFTLGKALRELSAAKTTVILTKPEQDHLPNVFSTAAVDLEQSLQAIEAAEEKLKEYGQLSSAINLARLSDDEQRNRLVEAAAVGLSARSLSHELHHYVRQLREGVSLVAARNKILGDEKIREATRLLSSVARELSKTVSAIDPLLPGSRSLKENISVRDFLSKFVQARRAQAQLKKIDIIFDSLASDSTVQIRFSRTRLLQVVENLFQNSVYWLARGPLTDPRDRRIVIEETTAGFVWWDSGPGIKPSIESAIFDPFISDKPSSEGQGLGLHIVATFLEAERCSIKLSSERNAFGRRYRFVIDLSPATLEYNQPKLFPTNG